MQRRRVGSAACPDARRQWERQTEEEATECVELRKCIGNKRQTLSRSHSRSLTLCLSLSLSLAAWLRSLTSPKWWHSKWQWCCSTVAEAETDDDVLSMPQKERERGKAEWDWEGLGWGKRTTKLLLTFRSAFACVKHKSSARMLSRESVAESRGMSTGSGWEWDEGMARQRGGAKCWVRRFECRCQVLLFNVVGACQMQRNCTRQTICQSALALDLQHTQTMCERETERVKEEGKEWKVLLEWANIIYFSYNIINTQTTKNELTFRHHLTP